MIQVTRLDGSHVFINQENIQWMEAMPDTAITFLGGARIIVKDSIDDILERITDAATLPADTELPGGTK